MVREHEPVAQVPDVDDPGEFAVATVVNVEDEVHGVLAVPVQYCQVYVGELHTLLHTLEGVALNTTEKPLHVWLGVTEPTLFMEQVGI
jgi:hypothetical protein